MNKAKIDKLLRDQSSTAKKVYGCVPKQEQWTAVEILKDLKRLGLSAALSTVEGCLWSLSESGLIKVKRGRWKQAIPKATGEIWSGVAIASGTAGWFRFHDIDEVTGASDVAKRFDGSIATSGADLNMSNTTITQDGTTTIDSVAITLPAST